MGSARSVLFVAARDDLYGVSRALLGCARHLRDFTFSPLLVTPNEGPLQRAGRDLGIGTRSWRAAGLRGWKLLSRGVFGDSSITDWARSEGVNLVAAASLSALPSVIRLAKKIGVPAAVHLRNTYEGSGRSAPFVKYQTERADLVVAVSVAALQSYHQALPSRRRVMERVVPDGIELFTPLPRIEARARLAINDTERCLAAVGAIAPEKGTLFAAEVAASIPGVSLLIAGTGTGEYARQVRERAVARLLGFVPSIRESLSAFDLVLHPSRGEAFGLAPLEAMAAGVPVIASNVGGLPEALGDGAVLLPPNDRQAWVAAVRRILEDEAFRSDLIARGLAQAQRMSARAAAERTAAAYRELLG